ncbi:MAG: hypothetical protein WA383_19835 [Terriglobales bacterium]
MEAFDGLLRNPRISNLQTTAARGFPNAGYGVMFVTRRERLATLEKPDAKFHRIAEEIKANARWRKLLAGEYC